MKISISEASLSILFEDKAGSREMSQDVCHQNTAELRAGGIRCATNRKRENEMTAKKKRRIKVTTNSKHNLPIVVFLAGILLQMLRTRRGRVTLRMCGQYRLGCTLLLCRIFSIVRLRVGP